MRTVLTISHLSITDYTARGQIKTQKLEEGEHQFENVNTVLSLEGAESLRCFCLPGKNDFEMGTFLTERVFALINAGLGQWNDG